MWTDFKSRKRFKWNVEEEERFKRERKQKRFEFGKKRRRKQFKRVESRRGLNLEKEEEV